MREHRFDDVTRAAAALPRRRSLLLGGAGLAAALAGASSGNAEQKSRKKCKKQKKQCRQVVQDFCEGSMGAQGCLDELLPCCATCNVKSGVLCTIGALSTM